MADWEKRFDDYVERLGDVLGHADRRAPLRAYATGLPLPGERESVEPMAARVDPARVGAAHQSRHHFVAEAPRDDAALPAAGRGGPAKRGRRDGAHRPLAAEAPGRGLPAAAWRTVPGARARPAS